MKAEEQTLRALCIGNSYIARHHLARVVEAFVEAGNPDLDFKFTSVIYGGRTLADHWCLGTSSASPNSPRTKKEPHHELVNVVHGALQHYDLTDLADAVEVEIRWIDSEKR